MKKAPARGSDKQQMQAPNMGEIKKRGSERWKETTIGRGRESYYTTEMERKIGGKKKQPCLCKYAKPVPVNHSVVNILNAKDEQESGAHR